MSFYAYFFRQVSRQRLVALAAYSSLLIQAVVANACLLVSFSSTAVSVQRIACLLRPLLYRLYTDYIPTLLPAACRARRRWRPACAARPARRAVAVAVAEAKGVLNSKAAARDRGFIKSRVRQACVRTRQVRVSTCSWVSRVIMLAELPIPRFVPPTTLSYRHQRAAPERERAARGGGGRHAATETVHEGQTVQPTDTRVVP